MKSEREKYYADGRSAERQKTIDSSVSLHIHMTGGKVLVVSVVLHGSSYLQVERRLDNLSRAELLFLDIVTFILSDFRILTVR